MAQLKRDEGIPTGSGMYDILNTLGSDGEGTSSESEVSEDEGFVERVSDSEVSNWRDKFDKFIF